MSEAPPDAVAGGDALAPVRALRVHAHARSPHDDAVVVEAPVALL